MDVPVRPAEPYQGSARGYGRRRERGVPVARPLAYTLSAVNAELARSRDGQPETLDDIDAVYEAYYQSVYRAVRAIVLDPGLAEDVTQETFLKAYRHRHQYRPTGSVGGWLHRVAVRKALSAMRWHALQDRLRLNLRLRAHTTPTRDATLSAQLTGLLEELNPGTRAALILHFFHGYRQREVADILAIPEGTVATRIANGLKRMRKIMSASEENNTEQR